MNEIHPLEQPFADNSALAALLAPLSAPRRNQASAAQRADTCR